MNAAATFHALAEGTTQPWYDFAQTGPETLAGRYMRTFWHPVFIASQLAPRRAVPLRIMGSDLTLYRGETGAPHLLAFRCAHRGTQLSPGWVEGDAIRCFYHEWLYGPTGRCVEHPAEPEPFCARVGVASYPVVDYQGLVFAYLGEGPPPALPSCRGLEGEGCLAEVVLLRQIWAREVRALARGGELSASRFLSRRDGTMESLGAESDGPRFRRRR